MSFFGKNIKKIRTVKKLSQSAFADIFKLKRGSIGAYEEGRAEAKIDTIINISEYFGLSIDQLLRKELTFNEIYHIDSINEKFYNNRLNQQENQIPFVAASSKKDFIKNKANSEYLKSIPSISLPNFSNKTIAFESFDSSMLSQFSGIKESDIILAERIKALQISKLPKHNIIIVLSEDDLNIGIPSVNEDLVALNPANSNYQISELKYDQIISVWLVRKVISDSFLKDDHIEKKMKTIEQKFTNFEKEILHLKAKI